MNSTTQDALGEVSGILTSEKFLESITEDLKQIQDAKDQLREIQKMLQEIPDDGTDVG